MAFFGIAGDISAEQSIPEVLIPALSQSNIETHQSIDSAAVSTYSATWVAKVIAKIQPLIFIPKDAKVNSAAVVRVRLLPTLQVRSVTLLKSSGNFDYDKAVQAAILFAQSFPELPDGEDFINYLNVTIVFRPKKAN